MNSEPKNGWAFDRKINLSNLLTACVVTISVIWWAAQIEKRVAVLEVELKAFYEVQLRSRSNQMNRDEKQDNEVDKIESAMTAGFDKLNNKLDKIISR